MDSWLMQANLLTYIFIFQTIQNQSDVYSNKWLDEDNLINQKKEFIWNWDHRLIQLSKVKFVPLYCVSRSTKLNQDCFPNLHFLYERQREREREKKRERQRDREKGRESERERNKCLTKVKFVLLQAGQLNSTKTVFLICIRKWEKEREREK